MCICVSHSSVLRFSIFQYQLQKKNIEINKIFWNRQILWNYFRLWDYRISYWNRRFKVTNCELLPFFLFYKLLSNSFCNSPTKFIEAVCLACILLNFILLLLLSCLQYKFKLLEETYFTTRTYSRSSIISCRTSFCFIDVCLSTIRRYCSIDCFMRF